MRRRIILAAALVLAVLGANPSRAQVGYALYMQWDDTKLDLASCKQQAEKALHKSGFTTDIVRTANSVYARHSGGYTAGLRCIIPKQIVVFVVSGPKGTVASKYLDVIVKNF